MLERRGGAVAAGPRFAPTKGPSKMAPDEHDAIRKLGEARERILSQLSRVIVGQQEVIEELLISLFSRGHCLLEGVPGLAKTLMISTLARTLNLSFSRIQFTPDLMPADITGTEIIEENRIDRRTASVRFLEGPLFANVILADEINRTPPKTQAALAGGDAGAAGDGRPRAARAWPIRSSCWPRRTRSSRRAPTRCPRPSRTASCSRSSSTIRASTRSSRSPGGRPRR